MKVVIQRVKNAEVRVNNLVVGEISQGYLLLVGFTQNDTSDMIKKVAKKIVDLRIFSDVFDKMNLSLQDVGGSILSVSQFSLYADVKGGRRPAFVKCMAADIAQECYRQFNQALSDLGAKVEQGIFQADMQVQLINDGPVTIIIDSEEL